MWYRDQIYTIPKYIKKEIEKNNTNTQFPLEQQKTRPTTSQAPSSSLHLEECTWCFRHEFKINFIKIK